MDSIGLGDLLAVMNQKDNDGYGWGGSWFWVIILFFFFAFFGRGFGGYGDSGALTRAENYKNTCEITNAIHCEGEQTRALINANTMQELRDRLADRDRDLLTANFQLSQQAQSANIIGTLRPFPQPAYITCSPYESVYGNGCACASAGCGI